MTFLFVWAIVMLVPLAFALGRSIERDLQERKHLRTYGALRGEHP